MLSGFLIGFLLYDEITKNDVLDVKRFWTRSFRKIVPPYVLSVIAGAEFDIARNRHAPLDWMYAMWPLGVRIVVMSLDLNL